MLLSSFTAEATETEGGKVFCPRTQQGQGEKSCIYSIMSLFNIYPWQGTVVWSAQRWELYPWFLPCRESAGALSVLWIMSLDSKDQGLEEEKVSPSRFLETRICGPLEMGRVLADGG